MSVICERPLSAKEVFFCNVEMNRQNENKRLSLKFRDKINQAIDFNDVKPKYGFYNQLDVATAALVEFEKTGFGLTVLERAVNFLY